MDTRPIEAAEHARPHATPLWFRLSSRLQFGLGLVVAALGGAGLGGALGAWMGTGTQALAAAAIGGLAAAIAVAAAALIATRSAQADAVPLLLDEAEMCVPEVEAAAVAFSEVTHPLGAGHVGSVPGGAVLGGAPQVAETAPMAPPDTPSSFDAPTDIRDSLTGAFTQRYFIAAADREWSRIRRHGEDAALLMIDADRLRAINETHGQECGDAVLVHLTRLVNATLRQYDLMARFNAGVLVVYLPHTDPIGAIDVAERIRERIANFRMSWPTGGPVAVTVSVGVASIGADHAALDTVIGDAGAALRDAKAAGRNCVRAAPVPPKRSPANGATLGDGRTAGPR